jgi:hypothetical protein
MASHAVAYDDETVLWLADQIQRAADRSQRVADLEAAFALMR